MSKIKRRAKKIDGRTLRRISATLKGSFAQRRREFMPWIGLCGALGLVFWGLWLRELDERDHAPIRRTEVQVDTLSILSDASWQRWLHAPSIERTQVQKVADAWVELTRSHPGLPAIAPSRLAQVDGGRVTAFYRPEVSEDEVAAHATQASEQMGVVQVWNDQKGYAEWSARADQKRWSSLWMGLVALVLGGIAARGLWRAQHEQTQSLRKAMQQLGLTAATIASRIRRMLALRVAGALGSSVLLCAAMQRVHAWIQVEPEGLQDRSPITFRPRSLEIPTPENFRCDAGCAADPEHKARHEYIVDHKLGMLSRQDRALARHEKALRPWIWSLTRTPAQPAQRTVLAANLVGPELSSGFDAWEIEDAAFRRSLQEIERIARQNAGKPKDRPARDRLARDKAAKRGCAGSRAPWAKKSLSPFVKGPLSANPSTPRLQGLVDPALVVKAKRGAKVRASVPAEVSAILRDSPGRWTLILDAGHSWLWVLGGMDALEVNTGDHVRAGEILGEVARPDPSDEGVSALRVELWHGTEPLDPRGCFDSAPRSSSRLARKADPALGRRRRGRYTAR